MIKRDVFKIIGLCVLVAISVCCLTEANADSLLRIKKPKLRLYAAPGSSSVETIEVENPADKQTDIKVYIEDWEYKDSSGAKDFFPPGTTKLSSAEWINFSPKEFSLPPYGKEAVNVSVNVPQDANGARYAVIFFETSISSPPPAGGKTSDAALTVIGRIGTLLYVEPEGTINRDALFQNVEVTPKDGTPGYLIKGKLVNSGNVDAIVDGTFDVINEKGEVFARGSFNTVYTLQGDESVMTAEWDQILPEGKYDVIVSLDAGGKPVIHEMSVEIGPGGNILKQ